MYIYMYIYSNKDKIPGRGVTICPAVDATGRVRVQIQACDRMWRLPCVCVYICTCTYIYTYMHT